MTSPILLYYFKNGMVADLSSGGDQGGRRIDGNGSSSSRREFPAVETVWSHGPKCNLDEIAGLMVVVV